MVSFLIYPYHIIGTLLNAPRPTKNLISLQSEAQKISITPPLADAPSASTLPLCPGSAPASQLSAINVSTTVGLSASSSIDVASATPLLQMGLKTSKHFSNTSLSCAAKFKDFDTPEPTIKMPPLSPKVSPTTENRIFSGAVVSLRILDSMNGIDLNASTFEDEYNAMTGPKKITQSGSFCSSHWSMNLEHPEREIIVTNAFLDWLSSSSSNELDRYKLFNVLSQICFFLSFSCIGKH